MRLRQLFEDKVNDVAIMFGRFNPPHYGHKDAWLVASRFPQWYIGTNQSTQGPKDPLPFDIKIEAMKVLYPEIDGHLVAEQSWFTLAVMVYKKYGENATLHIVTDPNDKDVYVPMIQKQNGIDGDHGYYKFKSIEWARAERQSEASLVRKSVKDNKPDDFEKYSGVPADTVVAGKPYFDLVREYMFPYLQAEEEKLKKQQERDRLKAEKEQSKKAKSANKVKDAVPEDAPLGKQLSVQQLATISDEALDKAYGYGRSSPGNTFGWQANLKSAAYAKQMIDKGITDIEAISDAIHKGWNVTAKAFVTNPDQFDDTEKLRAAGKLDAKLQQRAQLMKQNYAQLPDDEKEKDRVVARALLTAIKGQGVAEGENRSEQKFIVTYYNSLSDKSYTVMVSGDDEYDAKDKVDYALGMGDRITGIKPARGNEPTDSEYKVYVDPRNRTGRPGIYDREKVTTEDAEPMDREFSLVKKLGRLGERIMQNPKLWDRYDEEIDSGDPDWIISLIMDGTGATFDEVVHLSDVFGEIGGGMGRIIDFAWAVKEGTWEEDFMNPYRKYRSQDVSERVRDPEDWDEGNTEPGNNFAVYINGKKWKVLPGPYGAYADSPEERREFQRLQAMAQRKSQETGKKWEVYVTGEPATR